RFHKPTKRVAAISIITLLLIASATFNITYSSFKDDAKKSLEEADFSVHKLDVIGVENDELIIELHTNVSNYESQSLPSLATLDSISMDLFNQSRFLGRSEFELNSLNFVSDQIFSVNIPLSSDGVSDELESVFASILRGLVFDLQFHAKIDYKLGLIKDSISFRNNITFRLDQQPVEFDISSIKLPNENEMKGAIEFGILNPFSASFILQGSAEVVIEDYKFGLIELDTPQLLETGWTNISDEVILDTLPYEALSQLFEIYEDSIELNTFLQLTIDGTVFDVFTLFTVGTAKELYNVEVSKISFFDLDEDFLAIDIDLLLTSNLPLDLNLSRITTQIATLSNKTIGELSWVSEPPVQLLMNQQLLIENIKANFTDLGFLEFLQIITDGAISSYGGVVEITAYNKPLYYHFSIDRIDV
ncbi:MAG: hypothetical protein ACXAB7_16325, partial [Candidatus Kariarchaeaceae archaeon]